ncbi:MAG: hypothetical protein ACI9V9_001368, partial [Oleispira sp.]
EKHANISLRVILEHGKIKWSSNWITDSSAKYIR